MSSCSHVLLGLMLWPLLPFDCVQAAVPLNIEVFTSSEFSLTNQDERRLQGTSMALYFVDGLEQIETTLSQDLPVQPERAKKEALHRIQQLDDDRMGPAKNAAIGLARAVQHGVDRYPAIVFDQRAVVYGVTDLVEALDRYDAWQREQAR
ncbi:MAG: TIGR03757 family integrating conjugative element protein [Planctomycetales bacterium]|nr:TIGR03757 family integrating conjugative element protein [Planctomycetales bacterium]